MTPPPPLSSGDLIGVAAPAGYLVEHDRFHLGCALLRDMGFEIFEPERRWPGYGYLADTDGARREELHRLWSNPEIKAVFALRGGFGCLRLLDKLNLKVIRAHPKMFIGFSDITVLHNHIINETGLMCLHGPGLATLTDCDQASQERLYHCLRGDWLHRLKENVEIVRAAAPAKGILLGGNGIILGQFSDDSTEPVERLRRNEFVWARVAELTSDKSVPIWGNFPIGHCRRNLTVPLGTPATMDSDTTILHFRKE